MLLMITNRRIRKGKYSDEEMLGKRFVYQYGYNGKEQGSDGFHKTGKKGFETALFNEINRLKNEEGINTPKIGLYIHGYNNNYQGSIDEIYDLENSLRSVIGYAPIIIGFSWPSSGKVVHYLSDKEEARDSVGAFTRALLDINEMVTKNERNCFSATFCIAHSMGNYVLRKGTEYLHDALGGPKGRLLFDEVILIAPDLASDALEMDNKGQYIAYFSRRVHVYYSKNDRALKASSAKRFGKNRLGRHGADNYNKLPGNIILIDAKGYANKESISGYIDRAQSPVSVHSSYRYHTRILEDITEAISSIDRDQITGRKRIENENTTQNNHYIMV